MVVFVVRQLPVVAELLALVFEILAAESRLIVPLVCILVEVLKVHILLRTLISN